MRIPAAWPASLKTAMDAWCALWLWPLDKAHLRGLQTSAMATARLLLAVSNAEDFPGSRKSKADMQAQLEELGLDIALKRNGKWDLVGGSDQ